MKKQPWYHKYMHVYGRPFSKAPADLVEEIRDNFARLQSDKPLVTVSIIAYNEERHLLACLWALSEMQCRYPVEVIGVDNDSRDRTAEIFKAVGLTYYKETYHGCGHARLCGLLQANGKYHINIDADTIYPPRYVELMTEVLERPKVVAVSSLWSYVPDEDHSRLALKLYEFSRDCYLRLLSFNRPELSVRGLVFAYHTIPAVNEGIRTDIKRGEDGSLALSLKHYGKIVFLRNREARPVTGYGTVGADGTLMSSFRVRALKAFLGIGKLFTKKSRYKDERSNLLR